MSETYIQPSFVHVDPDWELHDTWPEEDFIDNSDIGYAPNGEETWRLDLGRDGTLSLRLRDEPSWNGDDLPVYQHDDRDLLVTAQQVMCRLGYPSARDDRLTHEGGERWFFSWIPMTYTSWQISAVQRVIHMFVSPDFTREQVRAECQRLTRLVVEAIEKIESE